MALKTTEELRQEFIDVLQSLAPELTDDSEGSVVDVLSGVIAHAVSEVTRVSVDEFAKTFFDTANGPEVTGGTDDLQTLAVDHFGDAFARPLATKASGIVTFSRPTAAAGPVLIPAGTAVKTVPSSSGATQRFTTEFDVTLSGLSINASVVADQAGLNGNVVAGKVTLIDSALSDPSILVNNSADFAGGQEAQTDAEYRETIRQLITTLRGATKEAIQSAALAVAGVEQATAVEFFRYVRDWDIALDQPIGDYYGLPVVKVYVADANGNSSPTLIEQAQIAVDFVRAAGVKIVVEGATAAAQNWSISIVLNPAGPNFATLQADATAIIDTMKKYIQDLPIGSGFNRAAARQYLLAQWGPLGSTDILDISTSVPSGDIVVQSDVKMVPGTMAVV